MNIPQDAMPVPTPVELRPAPNPKILFCKLAKTNFIPWPCRFWNPRGNREGGETSIESQTPFCYFRGSFKALTHP